jgi:hypothetical protein
MFSGWLSAVTKLPSGVLTHICGGLFRDGCCDRSSVGRSFEVPGCRSGFPFAGLLVLADSAGSDAWRVSFPVLQSLSLPPASRMPNAVLFSRYWKYLRVTSLSGLLSAVFWLHAGSASLSPQWFDEQVCH